ncbi:MAG TPA: S-layer homology domain-containing protein [bacterium]
MRQFAMAVATVLVFAMISPAFAQPFADTPTNHWAYDAIAELAAKGLVEGYPDGTFKGDRAMTRYEMAMVVARLLARIESIQIPTPAPAMKPEVTGSDIQSIQRLVNEFRAELAAKNVRLTAVEEELNAMKAKLSNVRITGGLRFREDLNQVASGAVLTGNNNPQTGNTPAGNNPRGNRPRWEAKLGFDSSVAPDLHFIMALTTAQGYQFWNSSNATGFNAGQNGQPQQGAFGSIDSAFLDWKVPWLGDTTEIWFGRFGQDTPCGGGCYPVQFGPFGLLFNTGGDTWEDSTFDSGFNLADGLKVAVNLSSLADLHIQAAWVRVVGNIGSFSYPSGEDAYGVDANISLMEGLRLGAYYVGNQIGAFGQGGAAFQPAGATSNFYHVYGPGGGSKNPSTARCTATANGITCPAAGNGYGVYAQWDVMPGIHLDAEGATWNDNVFGTNDSGANITATWDLSTLLNVCCNLTASTGYAYYGVNFYPPYGAAEADITGDFWDALYPGNAQGLTVDVSVKPWAGWTLYVNWLSGNNVSNQMTFTSWVAGVSYAWSTNAKVTLKYRDLTMGNVDQANVLRAQIDYSF